MLFAVIGLVVIAIIITELRRPPAERLGIRLTSSRESNYLTAVLAHSATFCLSRENALTRRLGQTATFWEAKTDDARFDRVISIDSTRQDVVQRLRDEQAVREALVSVFETNSALEELRFSPGQVTAAYGRASAPALETARESLHELLPVLSGLVSALPPDSTKEKLERWRGGFAMAVPLCLFFGTALASFPVRFPTVDNSTHGYAAGLAFVVALLSACVILRVTSNGVARMRALCVTALITCVGGWAVTPSAVMALNGLSSRIGEQLVVDAATLGSHRSRKGGAYYWVRTRSAQYRLSAEIHSQLARQSDGKHLGKVSLTIATGALGLQFVSAAHIADN